MFRVTNAPWEAAPEPVPTGPAPQAEDDPATESHAASEFETVFFDLRQVPIIAEEAPSSPEQQAEPPGAMPTGEIETPAAGGESLEPELASRDETSPTAALSEESAPSFPETPSPVEESHLSVEAERSPPAPGVSETVEEASVAENPGSQESDSASAKSWSIGESEIVFSLPALPRLRALVDLSAVPWRPVGPPAWSRRDGGVPSSPILVPPASPVVGTPTLAQLYLDQGHADEAAELFGEVLRRDPDNQVARAGMDRVQRERGTVDARSLLRGFEPAAGGGLSAKQAYVLRRWATLVRQAHRRDAP
jgi:hypothetical protein